MSGAIRQTTRSVNGECMDANSRFEGKGDRFMGRISAYSRAAAQGRGSPCFRALFCGIAVACVMLLFGPFAHGEEWVQSNPLVPASQDWPPGKYWQPGKVGKRNFYFAEQGNYIRYRPEIMTRFEQTGIADRLIPGHWELTKFDPEVYKTLVPTWKSVVDMYLDNQYPIPTIHSCVALGRPFPTKAAIDRVGDLWLGDSMPEAPIYRLEPVFHFIKTGKKWVGSSMGTVNDEAFETFMRDRVMPRLEKELPFSRDPKHEWTRPQLRRLCDIYCEEFFNAVPNNRPIPWGMFLSPYHIADMPNVTTVAEKGADAFANARARGIMRQTGGGKIYYTWRGHEPTERYAYYDRGWFSTNREEWGYPLPHLWYYLFRPYLMGANYSIVEGMPASWVQDIEDDGQYELSTLGHIAKAMLDFADRHPDRGVPYAPVALLTEYTRDWPTCYSAGGTTYGSVALPYDDADHMNHGLLHDLIFPEHRHTRFSGGYSRTAPYGEIFDILSPNEPGKKIDPAILDGYKVVFALGGQRMDADYAAAIKQYVESGGTVVLNIADLSEPLPLAFFGVASSGRPMAARTVRNEATGKVFEEEPFMLKPLELKGAEILYASDSRPVVTRHRLGKGYAVLVAVPYMIQAETIESRDGMSGRPWPKKPILSFVDNLIESLTQGLTPLEIRRRDEDKPDLSWQINRKGDGWTVTLYNYSLKREELVARPMGTAKVLAEYPYRSVPFEIVCHAPMADVVELYDDRDVRWKREDGSMIVTESMRAGDIRVYEFQPRRVELPEREVHVNYALNRPVTASSTLKGFSSAAAVDGVRNNDDYWQSDLDAKRQYVLDLPQWLRVDLQQIRTVNHIFVQFHTWPHASLETRQFIYRYVIDVSINGNEWNTVVDESKNMDPARLEGLERWFAPVEARFARLSVTHNTALAGAQVVELQVRGPEKAKVHPERKSITPPWQVRFPEPVENAAADKVVYLISLKPKSVKRGWLPQGRTWEQMNGWIRLYADDTGDGLVCAKSLYGQSISEIVYEVPEGASLFAAAIGFGAKARESSVEFQVFVDGVKSFDSGLFRLGLPLVPVVVDVGGARELKLVVTDGGDGITNDYGWWGDARFIANSQSSR